MFHVSSGTLQYTDTLHRSGISLNRDLVTELDLITDFDLIIWSKEVSIKHVQRMQLANRGRYLLRTPGPVPFRTYISSNVHTILSWTVLLFTDYEFRTSLGISIFYS